MIAKISKFGKKKRAAFEGVVVRVVFGGVLVGLVGFFLYQNVSMAQKRSALERRLQKLQEQATQLSLERETLQAALENAQSEGELERRLREALYQREGEKVITILPPPETSGQSAKIEKERKRVWWNPFSW